MCQIHLTNWKIYIYIAGLKKYKVQTFGEQAFV